MSIVRSHCVLDLPLRSAEVGRETIVRGPGVAFRVSASDGRLVTNPAGLGSSNAASGVLQAFGTAQGTARSSRALPGGGRSRVVGAGRVAGEGEQCWSPATPLRDLNPSFHPCSVLSAGAGKQPT